MRDWWSMGGYAWYVWSAYGVVVGVMLGLYIQALVSERRAIERLKHPKHTLF